MVIDTVDHIGLCCPSTAQISVPLINVLSAISAIWNSFSNLLLYRLCRSLSQFWIIDRNGHLLGLTHSEHHLSQCPLPLGISLPHLLYEQYVSFLYVLEMISGFFLASREGMLVIYGYIYSYKRIWLFSRALESTLRIHNSNGQMRIYRTCRMRYIIFFSPWWSWYVGSRSGDHMKCSEISSPADVMEQVVSRQRSKTDQRYHGELVEKMPEILWNKARKDCCPFEHPSPPWVWTVLILN